VRDPEDGHDGFTRVLLDGAAERRDLPAHLLEEGGEEGLQTLRIVAGGQLGRPDKAGEEDSDGLALAEGRA
jgi:hypothetical protein